MISCMVCGIKDGLDIILDKTISISTTREIKSNDMLKTGNKKYATDYFDTNETKNYAVIVLMPNIIYVSLIGRDGSMHNKPHKIIDSDFKTRLRNAIKYISNWKDDAGKFIFTKISVAYSDDQTKNCMDVWSELQFTELETCDCSKLILLSNELKTAHQDYLFIYICNQLRQY